jgi:hypothetical protein
MAVEDIVALVGHAVEAHIDGEVHGFVKGEKEGLLLSHNGVQYVLSIQSREDFEGNLPQHMRGFTLYELGDEGHKDVGGEGG